MNELGLTRESLRVMAEQIVHDTVNKYVENLVSSGSLGKIVEDAFTRVYRDPQNRYVGFNEVLRRAASDAAAKFVFENVTIGKAKS